MFSLPESMKMTGTGLHTPSLLLINVVRGSLEAPPRLIKLSALDVADEVPLPVPGNPKCIMGKR